MENKIKKTFTVEFNEVNNGWVATINPPGIEDPFHRDNDAYIDSSLAGLIDIINRVLVARVNKETKCSWEDVKKAADENLVVDIRNEFVGCDRCRRTVKIGEQREIGNECVCSTCFNKSLGISDDNGYTRIETYGPRKSWDGKPDLKEHGWEAYKPSERFEYHEAMYWQKLIEDLTDKDHDFINTYLTSDY